MIQPITTGLKKNTQNIIHKNGFTLWTDRALKKGDHNPGRFYKVFKKIKQYFM